MDERILNSYGVKTYIKGARPADVNPYGITTYEKTIRGVA